MIASMDPNPMLFLFHEFEGCRVYTIPQVSRLQPVVEGVAEVGTAVGTPNLDPYHAVAVIQLFP